MQQGHQADPVVCLQLIYAGKVLKDTTLLVKDLVKVSNTAAAVFQVHISAAAGAALGAACVPLCLYTLIGGLRWLVC